MHSTFARCRVAVALLVACTLAIPQMAGAIDAPSGWPILFMTPRASGLTQPVFVTGDGTGARTYIVERGGRVLVTNPAFSAPREVFLDISDLTSTESERGLLGLAFAPDYATNGRFYISYTDNAGDSRIARVERSAGDPDRADRTTLTTVLQVGQPFANHNGGWIGFGPDGYLYVAFGDGGSAGDPGNRAQDLSTLLGKIIRIDVEGGAATYSIPAGNPFTSVAGARDEIWSLGVRNPWRCSFDASGTLFVADVGQRTREEVNVEPAGNGGRNYGWRRWEGRFSYSPGTAVTPSPRGLHFPEAEIAHETAESVTGGYRYRGTRYPQMRGFYVFGDFVNGSMWGMSRSGTAWTTRALWTRPATGTHSGLNISSYGEDDAGEQYVCSFSTGEVLALGDARLFSARLAGADRYSAAVQIAKRSFPNWTGVTHVVIASGEDRAAADPLAASGLCWAYDAPLLLTGARSTSADVRTALTQIRAVNGPVQLHIVGGTASVPGARVAELLAAAGSGSTAERVLATGDRYQLAAAIARRMRSVRPAQFPTRALIANGADSRTFFDALSMSAVTAATGSPILLTTSTNAPSATTAALRDLGLTDRWSAGGSRTLSPALLTRLGVPTAQRLVGTDRYDLSRNIANTAISRGWLGGAVISYAAVLPDAVAGGAAAGTAGGPLVVCPSGGLNTPSRAVLTANLGSVTDVRVLGGVRSVSDDVRRDIAVVRE